jgi:copper chaperone
MHTFRTNIKCGGCISKVKPFLDKTEGVKSWSVDLNSPDRILTVEGEISSDLIIKAIAAAGYRADKVL